MKVLFKKQIHGCFAAASTVDEYIEYECDLPFPPQRGMTYEINDDFQISTEEEDSHNHIEKTEIVYCIKENMFVVYIPSDREIYYAMLHKQEHKPIKDILKEYLDMGWKKSR